MLAKKPKGATEKRKTSSVSGLLWMFVGAVLTLMIGVFLYLSPLFDFSPADKGVAEANKQVQPRVNTDTDNVDYEFYDILPTQEMATIPDEALGEAGSNEAGSNTFEPDVVLTQPEGSTANTDVSPDNSNTEPSRNNAANSNNEADIVIIEENETYDGSTPAGNSGNTTSNNSGQSKSNTAGAGTASVQKAQPSATYILQINSFGNADEADRRRAQVLMAGVDAKVVKNTTSNGAPIYQVISRPMNNRQAVTTAQQRLQNNGIDSIIVEQRR
ncbi:SPOR domain-containing protein [Psychrobacter sp. 16-MNA-CIBAN-0192]|uniref:SPOR domain-containing protein n=1 Tax=Psychrobacter sp. 16-MNA-CIBAN-0192 TaxID=3140448 RepID=UPI00332F2DC5